MSSIPLPGWLGEHRDVSENAHLAATRLVRVRSALPRS
jgi:hypothetical protein